MKWKAKYAGILKNPVDGFFYDVILKIVLAIPVNKRFSIIPRA